MATKSKPRAAPETIATHKAQIIARMCEGESLRAICRTPGFPTSSAVIYWIGEDEAFSAQYARAREAQADALFDDLAEVAEAALQAETAVEVAARKLIIDTTKWRISKILPKKYGDKIELAGDAGNPLAITVIERIIIDAKKDQK